MLDVIGPAAASGIVCRARVSSGSDKVQFDIGGFDRNMVLQNDMAFGSVNANRRMPLRRWRKTFERCGNGIEIVADFVA
jgi:hypothetical protein